MAKTMMFFPETVEEFMEQNKIVDTEQIYTNGAELVPIFRMKQWFISHPCEPPRWVPVTERLPEEGSYLCTENHLGTIFIDVSYFDGKQWCLPNGKPHFVTEVIAWQPLPSPYKGGEEE